MESAPLLPGAKPAAAGGKELSAPSRRRTVLAAFTLGVTAVALLAVGLVAMRGDTNAPRPAAPEPSAATEKALDTSVAATPAAATPASSRLPNVVLFYIDDQGYNDMGAHSTDLSSWTPSISAVADEGIWLSNYYALCVCTPSRAALLTGMYPIHSGMQHGFITGSAMWGMDRSLSLLPQMLATAGDYNTHMVGKWHLGHFQESYLPLHRGFSSFFGHFSGFEGYFSHTAEITECAAEADCYHDLRDNKVPVQSDTFNIFLFDERVHELLTHYGVEKANAKTTPFFLYYAPSVMHAPLECPEDVMASLSDRLASIPNDQRKVFACMTHILDSSAGNLTSALRSTGLWEDTLIIMASDNGANVIAQGGGSNWPLRGRKGYLWEGGTKVNALVGGGLVPPSARGTVYDGLFHVTDWVPTLLGGVLNRSDVLAGQAVDGHNQWDSLVNKTESPRTDMVYNIDLKNNLTYGAIRVGDWKLLVNVQPSSIWPVPTGNNYSVVHEYDDTEFTDFLFNLADDPSESHDLRTERPDKFTELVQRFAVFEASMVPTSYCGFANDTMAAEAYKVEQFITPFVPDDVEFECPTSTIAQDNMYQLEAECLYSLRSAASCIGTPSAKKIAALPQMTNSSHPPPKYSQDTGEDLPELPTKHR